MAWTIKGATDSTLDATAHSLESLAITSAVLTFQSLAGDSLCWSAATTAATGAGTILPDAGQIVELWRDGVRKFKGHVTGIRAGTRQITITVEGPWWWMERTNLTSDQTSAGGTTAERPLYVFPSPSPATGHPDLKDHLEALIDRAIANGVPMARGTVAAAYAIPQATLAEQPCSEALATLLAWMPDSVTWFDYSGTTPTLNIGRRGDFTATTYTLGTDPVEQGELTPRLDLEVTRNELHYVTRNATTGRPEWATQASGTNTPGKRQIVAVSGPEIVDFLPRDDFESVPAWSYWTPAHGYSSDAFVWERDPSLGQAVGIPSYGAGAVASAVYGWQYRSPWMEVAAIELGGASLTAIGGETIPASPAQYWLHQQSLPDWALAALGAVRVRYSGTWVITWPSSSGPWPAWFETLRQGAKTGSYYATYSGSGPATYQLTGYTSYLARSFSVEGYLAPWRSAGWDGNPVYKPWEYSYLTPPAGLAANLVAAQNWVPWEGPLTLVADDCSGDNLLAAKYNLANGLAPCATMHALARGVTHDLMRGRTTVDLGAPARLDFGTLVSRIRREPKDNIVYL